jgi:heptosyltransferase III
VALVNQLNLKEYAALAKLSSLFIANSTGTIHIAAAVGTPVIGLYPQMAPLSAARWGPYTEKKIIFTPANRPVDCKKCLLLKKKVCECMESISIEEVYKAAVNYLVKN